MPLDKCEGIWDEWVDASKEVNEAKKEWVAATLDAEDATNDLVSAIGDHNPSVVPRLVTVVTRWEFARALSDSMKQKATVADSLADDLWDCLEQHEDGTATTEEAAPSGQADDDMPAGDLDYLVLPAVDIDLEEVPEGAAEAAGNGFQILYDEIVVRPHR
jgi:hypothetical protein